MGGRKFCPMIKRAAARKKTDRVPSRQGIVRLLKQQGTGDSEAMAVQCNWASPPWPFDNTSTRVVLQSRVQEQSGGAPPVDPLVFHLQTGFADDHWIRQFRHGKPRPTKRPAVRI